jgi:uncharacterized surface protein with fasciclin (FAS1) repeats
MIKMLTHIKNCFAVVLLATAFTACKHDNLEMPDNNKAFRNAGDFIRNNYDLTLFAAAVNRAGMQAELNAAGPITLMAPNNAAWAELGVTRASDFDKMNADSLRNLLRYHILGRRLNMREVPANSLDARYASLYEGREPFFTFVAYGSSGPGFPYNNLYVNGGYAVKTDVVLANGTLHVIDKVMKYTPGTVQDWLSVHAEYSVFVSALKKFGLWDQLAGEGPFTVFAPDNEAMEQAGFNLGWIQNANPSDYIAARLFGIYIVPKKRLFVTDFQASNDLYNQSGFKEKIAGDTYIYSLSGSKNTYQLTPGQYTLGFVEPPTADRTYELPIRGATSNISGRNDNLTDNGIVHYLPSTVVLPEEASKN